MSHIIAVGYELGCEATDKFKSNVIEMFEKKSQSGKTLQEKFPDFHIDDFVFQSEIKSGVFYSQPPAGDTDCRMEEEKMKEWYEKHESDDSIFIDSFYYHYSKKKNGTKNPLIIVASCHNVSGHRFFSFLSLMTSGPITTCHKRNIRSGLYSGPFTFGTPLKVPARSYAYWS